MFEKVDLQLRDESVSRIHAKFELVGDALMVTDLGSTNDTVVAGRKVGKTPVRVDVNDSVKLGSVKLVVSRA
jgi:pSer/pThr/pTyr-binding forkhead associated (FHA) protein